MCSRETWNKLRQQLSENDLSYFIPLQRFRRVYFVISSPSYDDRVMSMSLDEVEDYLNRDDIDTLVALVILQLIF